MRNIWWLRLWLVTHLRVMEKNRFFFLPLVGSIVFHRRWRRQHGLVRASGRGRRGHRTVRKFQVTVRHDALLAIRAHAVIVVFLHGQHAHRALAFQVMVFGNDFLGSRWHAFYRITRLRRASNHARPAGIWCARSNRGQYFPRPLQLVKQR